jgi:hypothetical protein
VLFCLSRVGTFDCRLERAGLLKVWTSGDASLNDSVLRSAGTRTTTSIDIGAKIRGQRLQKGTINPVFREGRKAAITDYLHKHPYNHPLLPSEMRDGDGEGSN